MLLKLKLHRQPALPDMRWTGRNVIMPPTHSAQDQTHLNVKNIGREASSDLVLDHATASRLHARLELAEDGSLWLADADSSNGLFLHRNDSWIRVFRMTLCVGDRIRFGDHEVPLQQLTALFGKRDNIRLGAKYFSLPHAGKGAKRAADWDEPASSLQKPKRNPLTGKIEEDRL